MEPNRFMVGDIIRYDLGGAINYYYLVVEVSNEEQYYLLSNLEFEAIKRELDYKFAHDHYSIISRA